MTESLNWRDDALCTQFEGNMWFSENSGWTSENKFAQELCNQCPVKKACLAEALDEDREAGLEEGIHGIRGGMSSKQRREHLRMENRVGRNLVDSTPHAA